MRLRRIAEAGCVGIRMDGLVSLFVVAASAAQACGVTTELVRSGFVRPVYATAAPGDTERLFVVEQNVGTSGGKAIGRIRILNLVAGTVNDTAFLEVPGLSTNEKQGLLSMTFHPDYETNGYFYINSVVAEGDHGTAEVRRYEVSADDANVADASSGSVVIRYALPSNPFGDHVGNWLGFGPDNYLYYTTGDGSCCGDPYDNGQNTSTWLGKILRLDVNRDDFPGDATRNYGIPEDNPFAISVTEAKEIWAYGLRNPWRASFDRLTGDLYLGDVGDGSREEVSFQPANQPGTMPGELGYRGGANYGWPAREGTIVTPFVGGPKPPGAIDPIYDYPHGFGAFSGFSVIGGYVYRGPIASIQGKYFFADFNNRRIWSIEFDGTPDPLDFDGTNIGGSLTDWTTALVPDQGSINAPSSFAEDSLGNLYLVDIDGEIFKFVPELGDMDCDGDIDFDDIAPFVLGLNDSTTYQNMFGVPPSFKGDIDRDGDLDFDDIMPFVDELNGALAGEPQPVPEPPGFPLAATGLVGLLRLAAERRRSLFRQITNANPKASQSGIL